MAARTARRLVRLLVGNLKHIRAVAGGQSKAHQKCRPAASAAAIAVREKKPPQNGPFYNWSQSKLGKLLKQILQLTEGWGPIIKSINFERSSKILALGIGTLCNNRSYPSPQR